MVEDKDGCGTPSSSRCRQCWERAMELVVNQDNNGSKQEKSMKLTKKRVETEIYMLFRSVGISGMQTDIVINALTEKCYAELSENEELNATSFSYAIKQFCLEKLRDAYL